MILYQFQVKSMSGATWNTYVEADMLDTVVRHHQDDPDLEFIKVTMYRLSDGIDITADCKGF